MVEASCLQRMRRYRGRDEAIDCIRDKTLLADILQNSSTHTRDEINGEIMSCYAGNSYGDSNWTRVYGAWGNRPEIITINGHFASQYPQLVQLNFDAGLVTHLPEFMDFLRTTNNHNYLDVRKQFKKYLGNKTVWRGMVLTDEDVNKIKSNGIESDFFRSNFADLSVENFEANILSTNFDELVERHFHGENPISPLISVSSFKDVAIAVGRHFGRNKLSEGNKELYLFKINIPEIDLIYYTDHAVKLPYKLQDLVKNGVNIHTSVNGEEFAHPWDKDTESYILYKINPDEIVEISKPFVTKSSWNRWEI